METRLIRLPSKQLLLDYLQLYIDKRAPDRQTTGNYLKQTWERGASYVTGNEPADIVLDKLVTDIQLQISNTREWMDWYYLIFNLRDKAEEAQAQKTRKEEDSLLRETFHAMACLIVSELKECLFEPGTPLEKSYGNVLYRQIAKLKKDLETAIESGNFSVRDKQGLMRDHFVRTENELLRTLAYLCDIDSIHLAGKQHLLDHLRPPSTALAELLKAKDSANLCGPFALQEKYCEWIYAFHFQPIKQVAFNDFKSRAYATETLEIGNKIQRKTLELQSIQKRKEMEKREFKKQDELKRQMETLSLSGHAAIDFAESIEPPDTDLPATETALAGLHHFGQFPASLTTIRDDERPLNHSQTMS